MSRHRRCDVRVHGCRTSEARRLLPQNQVDDDSDSDDDDDSGAADRDDGDDDDDVSALRCGC